MIDSVQNVQMRGSSPYPNVDSAIENNVDYRVFREGNGSPCGWLRFCGGKNYVDVEVAQIRWDMDGKFYRRKGIANSGTVTWDSAWTAFDPDDSINAKMDLVSLNPSSDQIAAMPSGQLYGDTVNHKGTSKGGQSFYDTEYIDTALALKAPLSDFNTLSKRAVQPSTVIITKDNWQDYSDANSFTPNRAYGISSLIIGPVPPEGETPDPDYGYVNNLPSYGSTGYLMYYTASSSSKNGVQLYHNGTENWYRTVNSSGAGTWVQLARQHSLDKAIQPEVVITTSNCDSYPDANNFTANRTYGIQSAVNSNMVRNLPSYGSTGYLMYYTASASVKNGVQLFHNETENWYRTVNSSGAGAWRQLASQTSLDKMMQPTTTITPSNYASYPDANSLTPNRTYGIQSGITEAMVANLPSYGSTGYLMYYTASASAKNGVQFYHNAAESWYRTVDSNGEGVWIDLTKKINPNVEIADYFVHTCVDKPIELQSGKGLFIFGDSITTNSHGRLTWGSIIADKTGCTEYNYGVGSAAFVPSETRPDLKIMTQIEGVPSDNWVNCDVCIVAAGTNDSNYHTTAEALRSEVQNVITAIKTKAPNAKIIFITPIRRADSAVRLSQLPAIAGAICNVALINGCSVINGFDFPIPTYSNDWIENLTSDSTGLPVSDEHPGDGLHPGIVGKRIYAQSVLNALL